MKRITKRKSLYFQDSKTGKCSIGIVFYRSIMIWLNLYGWDQKFDWSIRSFWHWLEIYGFRYDQFVVISLFLVWNTSSFPHCRLSIFLLHFIMFTSTQIHIWWTPVSIIFCSLAANGIRHIKIVGTKISVIINHCKFDTPEWRERRMLAMEYLRRSIWW